MGTRPRRRQTRLPTKSGKKPTLKRGDKTSATSLMLDALPPKKPRRKLKPKLRQSKKNKEEKDEKNENWRMRTKLFSFYADLEEHYDPLCASMHLIEDNNKLSRAYAQYKMIQA